MIIKNKGHVFSDNQLERIIQELGADYQPAVFVVCENRQDLMQYFASTPCLRSSLADVSLWLGKTEGIYLEDGDVVVVFTFSQTDDGEDLHSRQLYSIHAMLHELFHRYVAFQQYKMSDSEEEQEADRFATKFVNEKSGFVAEVMGWDDEWSMWEEE